MSDSNMLLERAQLLLDQGRHNDAKRSVSHALELDPENDYALALLARCNYANKQYNEGIIVIRQAIALDPQESFYFYLLGFGLYQQNNTFEAISNLKKALELNPYNGEYYGLLAYVLLDEKALEEALEKANEGLAIDADNITCLNARSVALNKLRRTDAAVETMQNALAQDPDNEMTHTTVGWNLLEKGKHKEATKHFLESLRIDPNYESSREGLKEALKSKVLLYKWLLQYSFWVQNKGKKWQTILPIALYIIFRVLIAISSNANQNNLAWVLGSVYILLVVISWTINSIANFILLFNPIGKYALTITEKWTAISVVAALATGLLILCTSQFTPLFDNTLYGNSIFTAGVVCISLALPLSQMEYPFSFKNIEGWRDWYSFLLLAAGVTGLCMFLLSPPLALIIFIIYGIAFIIYNWVGLVRN